MNLLDFAILLPIGYFTYKGFVSGIIQEVFGIAGIILAVFLTFKFMKPASVIFSPLFNNPDHATIAAGIFIFIGTVAAIQFLAFTSRKFLELLKINFLNRLAGMCFGFLKSGIVVSAFLLLFAGFNLPGEQTRENSFSYSYVIYLAPAAFNTVATIYPGAEDFVNTIEETIEENNPIRSLPIFDKLEL